MSEIEIFKNSILFNKLKELKEKEKDSKRDELIEKVYKTFEDEINAIKDLFSDFTSHDVKHCESVVRVLEELVIGKDLLEKAEWKKERGIWKLYIKDKAYLNEDEITLLFLGILLHDIGMSPEIDEELGDLIDKLKLGKISKEELENIKKKIREEHHNRSKEFVESSRKLKRIMGEYGFKKYIPTLAKIVEGHRKDPYDLFDEYRTEYHVRTPLLAFLIEIADDMDIGQHRVERFILDIGMWHNLNKEGIKHVVSNMNVERFYREGDRVEYEVIIEDFDEHNFILEHIYKEWDKIENRINKFCSLGILREREDLDAWRYVLPSKIDFKFHIEGVKVDCSKGFEVDKRLFADLLSERIYEGKWKYAFRELITNAFDAIKRRAYEEGIFDNPKVDINIKFIDEEWMEITIEDNGIGMNWRDIEDYLLKVGRSFYNELREKNLDEAKAISPTGYYGIGFLSSFMLLKNGNDFEGRIEIESKRKGYDAVKVIILNPNLPVVKFRSNKEDIGTKIAIRCKRKDVREFFEKIVAFVRDLEKDNKNINMFPFTHIINSVFNINDKSFEIKIKIDINGCKVWDKPITPDLFIDGEKIKSVEVKRSGDTYKLEIWSGNLCYCKLKKEKEDDIMDIIIEDIIEDDILLLENLNKLKIPKHVHIRKVISVGDCIYCINGLLCDELLIPKYENCISFLAECCKIENKNLTIILAVETSQPIFTDLKKSEIIIDNSVIRDILNKLADDGVYYNLCNDRILAYYDILNSARCYRDFINIGAEKFVKKCLRFKDIFGNWITIEEIEKNGKKPLVADIFIANNYEEFKDFFEKNNIHLLSPIYDKFFEQTYIINLKDLEDYVKKLAEIDKDYREFLEVIEYIKSKYVKP